MRRYRNKTRKIHGGSCGPDSCQLPQSGGIRIGVMNPTWGGGCGCGSTPKPMMELPPGVSLGPLTLGLKGGACPCQAVPKIPTPLGGGYRPTKRDLKYLKLWKQGKSIGFTMRSSLKAKGLIPRANGTKRVSNKYKK